MGLIAIIRYSGISHGPATDQHSKGSQELSLPIRNLQGTLCTRAKSGHLKSVVNLVLFGLTGGGNI